MSSDSEPRSAGFKAALASTASRTLALYFSRPIRLFRPSKISGWHTLNGQSLPLLIKQKGWTVIPRHFLPPLFVNALLGTILWTTYAEAAAQLEARSPALPPAAVAALAGGCAGAAQALAAAPAENVRIVLEGGRFRGSWSVAWREVFAETRSLAAADAADAAAPAHHRDEVRRVRRWLRDARDMAGRGWQGWRFGAAKDGCGFAVFFAVFEVSRQAAARARALAERKWNTPFAEMVSSSLSPGFTAQLPRVVHSTAIVAGGLLAGLWYELVCRPFDVARRAIRIATVEGRYASVASTLARKAREDGAMSFFRDPTRALTTSGRANAWLRLLGRVGPWGVAFLAWENFGRDVP